MTGRIKYWDDRVGYGFILGDDDVEYFCHQSELRGEDNGTLREGQKVEFQVLKQAGRKAPMAKNVKKI